MAYILSTAGDSSIEQLILRSVLPRLFRRNSPPYCSGSAPLDVPSLAPSFTVSTCAISWIILGFYVNIDTPVTHRRLTRLETLFGSRAGNFQHLVVRCTRSLNVVMILYRVIWDRKSRCLDDTTFLNIWITG